MIKIINKIITISKKAINQSRDKGEERNNFIGKK